VSRPPRSSDSPHTSSLVAARVSISITSRSSIGLVLCPRHAGTASTGSRSTSLTRNRNDRDWAPITIDARNATEHGAAASRISSTARRLARCAEAGPPSGTSPPEVDDTLHAGRARLTREVLGRGPLAGAEREVAGVPVAGRNVGDRLHRVHQEVRDVDIVQGVGQPVAGDCIAGDDRDGRLRRRGVPAEAPDGVAVALEPGRQPGSDEPGNSGHEDVHRGVPAAGFKQGAIRYGKLRKLRRVSAGSRNIPLFAGI
jgi:hypothetical protein